MLSKCLGFFTLVLLFSSHLRAEREVVVVGSKRFSENFVIAEIFSQLLESKGYQIERKFAMGGSMATFYALESEEIDVYPEYTGTVAQAILKNQSSTFEQVNKDLEAFGLEMLPPLGFNNSYALVMREDLAQKLNISSISDLAKNSYLRGAISFEFQERKDGWPGLVNTYNLKNPLINMDVPLNYEALKNKKVDFAEAYTTEPLVDKFGFIFLNDDKNFFPQYLAAAMVHSNVSDEVRNILGQLAGKINNERIRSLTHKINEGRSIEWVANDFLVEDGLISKEDRIGPTGPIHWQRMFKQTKTHLSLTLLAVFLATLIAVPLASIIAGLPRISPYVLGFTGILQTIPSIALLTFMIPFFGIGFTPAIVGLFVYSLLPIVRNTHTAMTNIDPVLITAARGIGLYPMEIFLSVKLPLAFPTILAGIRTATTLNIGTATLAAFIGAGGLGVPIVTGLALNDTNLVLQGAVPAAILAIIVDLIFAILEKFFTKQV